MPPHLRLASVPARHPYVEGVLPLAVRLNPTDPPGPWRPSPVLQPGWLRAHAREVDVVHVHFGYEHLEPADVAGFLDALDQLGLPLVVTVHDLDNPHLHDQAPHVRNQRALVRAADAVLTLTSGAAAEVQERYGVAARVLPHPHVAPLERMGRRRRTDGLVLGLHDKRRASTDPDAVREPLVAAVRALPGARLLPAPDRRLSDDELWDRLALLDVLVLPYRHGTHSGFVEACYDLGTTVLVPAVGHLAEQHPVVPFDLDDPSSLLPALRHAQRHPGSAAAPAARAREAQQVREGHAEVYRALVRSLAA